MRLLKFLRTGLLRDGSVVFPLTSVFLPTPLLTNILIITEPSVTIWLQKPASFRITWPRATRKIGWLLSIATTGRPGIFIVRFPGVSGLSVTDFGPAPWCGVLVWF